MRKCKTLDLRFCALLTGGASEMELALASGYALVACAQDCVQVGVLESSLAGDLRALLAY